MRVHAFLATSAELPALLERGSAPPTAAVLTGVDPVNLASLVEILTGGGVGTEEASAALETPVLEAGPHGPSIHLLPEGATVALGNAGSAERARWTAEWSGGNWRLDEGPEKTIEALVRLATGRAPAQGLYLWVANGR
ncbi:MAG TPA: hypothetical protein VFN91_02460 [Myxococcaceae bacterium]|nr:hypothetical protein [Myxococcaceae bacterium]